VKPSHKIPLPDIPSDFYISPLDWSRTDILALGLSAGVCFINPKTAQVTTALDSCYDISSLKFSPDGDTFGLGTEDGLFTIYSTHDLSQVAAYILFETSVLCCDWQDNLIAAGSRAGDLSLIDVRDCSATTFESIHNDEICTVRFGNDPNQIATSSNDTTVRIWDMRNLDLPSIVYGEHTAAVRALQWSPLARDVIATGGGVSDQTLRLWNVNTGDTITWRATRSQVCNLCWNAEYNEILSTHGFSQHQLALWRGADLEPVAQFYEHKQRVLYMAMSPDSTRVATAAPQDELQIWTMFPSKRMSLERSMLTVR
jgi:WD40 repeat protein